MRPVMMPCLLTCFLSGAGSLLAAQCDAPSYKVGRIDQETSSSIAELVSIKLIDFTPRKLICLVGAIKARYQGHSEIFVSIFSDQRAARYYSPSTIEMTASKREWQFDLHAMYDFNAAEHRDRLLLIPDNLAQENQSSLNTVIELPAGAVPPCQLQLKDRCLIKFNTFKYTKNVGRGEVTMTAIISPERRRSRRKTGQC